MNYIVRIELQRVQTFLFAVPRLADIIGANALLGKVLRYDLPKLALSYQCQRPNEIPKSLSCDIKDDPIAHISISLKNAEILINDDPKSLWEKGILARDGGHFSALFLNNDTAEGFVQAARNLIRKELPGLRCELHILSLDELRLSNDHSNPLKPANATTATALFSLPMLQQCQETGNDPAICEKKYGDETRVIGKSARQRKKAWEDFKNRKTIDIATLMCHSLELFPEENFETLCDSDYLALIHADGNGLGKAMAMSIEGTKGLEKEAAIENFFQAMRVNLRLALKQAIDKLIQSDTNFQRKGLQILMLGGDDLLIACRASLALPLAEYLAQSLTTIQLNASYPKLTLGIGIAIAKPSFPFHRLHALAEELATSSKRLVRSMEKPVSVIDWEICSEAWHGDVKAKRQSSQLLRYKVDKKEETLLLSAKPYFILNNTESASNTVWSLSKILAIHSELQNKNYARSQLRGLVRLMRKGRYQSDSAFLDLELSSKETWNALYKVFKFQEQPSLWLQLNTDQNIWLSHFVDLVEVIEISKLQTEKNVQSRERVAKTVTKESNDEVL